MPGPMSAPNGDAKLVTKRWHQTEDGTWVAPKNLTTGKTRKKREKEALMPNR